MYRSISSAPTVPIQVVQPTSSSDFLRGVSPKEKALFGAYLAKTVFPHVHGEQFITVGGTDIFEVFDEIELQWYFRYWKKHFTDNKNPADIPAPPAFAQ
jgi:hypothetical protein